MNLKIIIGIILFLNFVGYLLIWLQANKNIPIEMNEKIFNKIIVLISIVGGFIGVYLSAEMYGFETGRRWFNVILKRIVFFEVLIIVILVIYFLKDYYDVNISVIR